jgi:Xaa-Pro aminopeptidase
VIERSEFAHRQGQVAAALAANELDALLVTALPDVRYLSGFTGSNGAVLLTQDSSTLFTDPRYTLQAAEETGCSVVIAKKALNRAAAILIGRKRLKRVGLDASHVTWAAWHELQTHVPTKTTLIPAPDIIGPLRMLKSPAEIELIRQAVLTNSQAYEKAVNRLKPSWSENDLAAEIEFHMRRFGAEGAAFESIVAAGVRSALPHARPTAEAIGSNRLLLMDIGALRAGYTSDMTRVVHLGKPGTKTRRLYKAVLEAQLSAVDAVREGVTAGSVDRAARSVLKRHGMDRFFVHSTGHGLGLEIHESPRLGRAEKTRLQSGMVITIEPGAYLEGFGGVRIEDTVVVTKTGCEILTPTAKELLVI